MQFDFLRIWPYLIATLAVLLIYRRLRRSFGRQRLQPVRMGVRIGIFIVLGCSLLPAALQSGQYLAAELVGVMAGMALGAWGALRTRFLTYNGQLHYVPHTVTGIAVSLLFIGRLVYHLAELYLIDPSAGPRDGVVAPSHPFAPPAMMSSPLTVGLLFLVIGYYVCFYGRVLWKSKRLGPEELEVVSTSSAAAR